MKEKKNRELKKNERKRKKETKKERKKERKKKEQKESNKKKENNLTHLDEGQAERKHSHEMSFCVCLPDSIQL